MRYSPVKKTGEIVIYFIENIMAQELMPFL